MAKYKLMKHQAKAVKFIESQDGIAALLFEPGTGKTGSVMAWLDKLASRQKEVRVLVVAPLTATDTWVLQVPLFMDTPTKSRMLEGSTPSILAKIAQARNWADVPDTVIKGDHPGELAEQLAGRRVTIMSMSAGAISSFNKDRSRTVQILGAVRKYAPHVIVMDESQLIKSATANISKAMYQIGQLAPHRLILTGTVNPHSPLDCYGQWRFLAPWTFSDDWDNPMVEAPMKMTKTQQASIHPWPWTRFKLRYSLPGGYKGKGISGYCNQDDLKERVAQRSMVILADDVLDLPPIMDIPVHVRLSAKEEKTYRQMHEDLVAQMADGSLLEAPNALAKIMKLRQITAGFVRDTETEVTHVIGTSKQKAVCEVVNITLAGEQRVVVFAYFKTECANLAAALATPGTTVEVITGATKPQERLAIRKRFGDVSRNPGRMVLVAQARTMSISVNELVTAQHAVFASLSERRDDWVQARGRLKRQGQQGGKDNRITFWNVGVEDTVDSIMRDRHLDRGDMEKALLDHIRHTLR